MCERGRSAERRATGVHRAACPHIQAALHHLATRVLHRCVLHHREHPQHGELRREETIERGVHHVANGRLDATHDRLQAGHCTDEVTAVDRRRAAEADDDVLGEVRHADHLVRHHLADRDDEVPPGEQLRIDGDRDRLGETPAGEHADLFRTDLAERAQPVAPVVTDQPARRDRIAEHGLRIGLAHRHMRAEGGQHAHLDALRLQKLQQLHSDRAGA